MTQENIKSKWIKNAFAQIEQNKYPRVKAISWWHENFDHSGLRIDTSPESLAAYSHQINSSRFISKATFLSN